MIAHKPSILCSSWNTLHSFSPTIPTCSTSSRALSPRDHRCQRARQGPRHRQYATIASDNLSDSTLDGSWPDPPKGKTCPTPYQIFGLPQDAPYSKTRFYRLVKLYHPDRSNVLLDTTTCEKTKLERYRLIVAAHDILSDPVKRSAYDRWGAGWGGKADIHSATDPAASGTHQPGPFSSSWRDKADPHIWANATWEDWERWRARQDPRNVEPVYMSNLHFASMIAFLALVGSSWTYSRADQEGERFLAARDAVHDRSSRDLRRVRQDTGQIAKDERIQWFLRNREATMLGLNVEELRNERAKRWLPEQEACMSDGLKNDEQD